MSTPKPYDPIQDTVVLVKKKLAMRAAIPSAVLDSVDADAYWDHMTDNIIMRLKATVLGEQLPSHVETASTGVPATWWQHFKHTYAGKWWMRALVRRRPVKLRTITLTATWEEMAAYPWHSLRTELPQYMGAAVRIPLGSTTNLDFGSSVIRYWEDRAGDE